MALWNRSECDLTRMEDLVQRGLLHVRTDSCEWELPGDDEFPAPPAGYVVSFVHFHERGLVMPPHRFLLKLLDYYKIPLHHLNPNGIKHIAVFIALCEGYLGIEPYFDLWWHFFSVNLQKREHGRVVGSIPMGCASIYQR
jgi:hypothetical protein